MKVVVAGGGIGGLTLALSLQARFDDVDVHVYDAAPVFKPLGLGINLMPHCVRVLTQLGLRDALSEVAVEAQEFVFATHNGQIVYREPTGRYAGHDHPHFSIHRGDLHAVLLDAVLERLGPDHVHTDHRLVGVTQDDAVVTATFHDSADTVIGPVEADVLIGCDGVHSVVRRTFYPHEGPPVFHGINMWRGVTRMPPFLSGASATRIGALFLTGKLAVYPIRNDIDQQGNQLVNWIAEVVTDEQAPVDWSAAGDVDDFLHHFEDWKFDWLDCGELIRNGENVLSYPMVDRDPVDRWTFGRVTLLGDAAHPMYPRGGNGGAQAILDAEALAKALEAADDPRDGLSAYERERLPIVNNIVLTNRTTPPDTIIEVVEQRTNGEPYERLEDVISLEELQAISLGYQRVAGYDRETVARG
ncbi:flavin-dependent oxidoreductase [Pseudonocardia zijingensis]|jgi:2-polyprenyl-6-methoxyphenol hydroxylase-like FAD-dependent oxidoreductase|uniref:Flavin-dependent oxidoreductase n=1 Tax=Pseudonocardia zijingensis TaxID=153376 RepID=A0ABN1PYG6_9PSEU